MISLIECSGLLWVCHIIMYTIIIVTYLIGLKCLQIGPNSELFWWHWWNFRLPNRIIWREEYIFHDGSILDAWSVCRSYVCLTRLISHYRSNLRAVSETDGVTRQKAESVWSTPVGVNFQKRQTLAAYLDCKKFETSPVSWYIMWQWTQALLKQ